jgi:FtsP/CotA-like multicopper oxidase with cupredoxin domain
MKRRRFLGSALAGIGGLIVGCNDSHESAPSLSSAALTEGAALRNVAPLANDSSALGEFRATLRAAPAQVALLPDQSTAMFLYNDACPGPLIELKEGQHVRIALDNALPEDSTIHWHGLPVPPDQDGNPMDPVHSGARRVYEFDIPTGAAGTYWYHPHPNDTTASQVVHGMAGPMIVRAADDPLAHLPEVSMFITALRLDAGGAISPDNAVDWTVGRQKETLLVNGGRLPVHTVRPGTTQRWRIFNATSARHFRLVLDGHTFTLVGTDGGLLAVPVTGLSEILIAPAQRIEIVVTVATDPNMRYRLRALRYETDLLGLGSYGDEDLLTLATTSELPATPAFIPSSLRPIKNLGNPTARQAIELGEATGLCMRNGATIAFLINGRIFDPDRIDLVTKVGRVELWDIVNYTGMAHPFHIHGTQFQLVSRQIGAQTIPAPYLAWIDTVLVPPQQAVTIKVKQDMPGKRMFHCHILEHEDNCMMAILDVQP